jgi:hypothetical protein
VIVVVEGEEDKGFVAQYEARSTNESGSLYVSIFFNVHL